jgi:3-oxoacyl-[acyl-carrier protein] reductase
MQIRFDGQVVLITGASTGIGRAAAIQFGRCGAKVIVNYNKSENEAKQVVHEIQSAGSQAVAVQADVAQPEDIKRLFAEAVAAFGGRIDILVNNAGSLLERTKLADITLASWDMAVALNYTSVFLCSQAVMPIMKEQKFGRIINLTSIAARNGGSPGAGHYASAKAAVLCLTKNLAKELATSGITVNAVSPGVISTPFHDKFTEPAMRKQFVAGIPLGREGTADEVAYTILFLASRYADYIVGENIEINGGQMMD